MEIDFRDVVSNWRRAWRIPGFRFQVIATTLVLVSLAFTINRFFSFVQARSGTVIDDPILNEIGPYDMSVYIFVLIYIGLVMGLMYLIKFPMTLVKVAQAYALLVFLRMGTLVMFPLEPSKLIIPLSDPLVDQFFYNNNVITKDLFFSGHVATLFLFVLGVPNPLKYFFIVITLSVAILILIQHVHYTIDILAAPLFSWIAYKIAGLFTVKIPDIRH